MGIRFYSSGTLHPSLKIAKLSGVLGIQGWVVWIHEKLQLDPFRLVLIRFINLVHLLLLHLGIKRNGAGYVLVHRRRQSSRGFRKLTHSTQV
jgi:hypothetical protein